jgi:hypothetical protein
MARLARLLLLWNGTKAYLVDVDDDDDDDDITTVWLAVTTE